MRVCLVTREYPPITPYTGGIGTSFAALGRELGRRPGYEPHVITVGLKRPRDLEHEGVYLHLCRPSTRPRLWFLEDVSWTFEVDRMLRRLGRFDAIYAAEWGGDAWRYSLRKRSGPLVTKLATSLAQALEISPGWNRSLRMRFRHLLQNPIERGQAQRSDALVAPSQAVLDWARELWTLDHIPSIVIPNPIDLERVSELSRGVLSRGFPQHGPVVLFTGRVEIRKGAHVLVEAMDRVWSEYPDAHLVMVGRDGYWNGGSMSDYLRHRVGTNADRLHLLGVRGHDELFPALAAADVVALPSLWEAFGIVALEAMALGRPLVVTDAGGFREFVRDEQDGLVVPPNDAATLADAIRRLLGDRSLRERMGASAATRAQEFASAPIADRFVAWFGEVARQS